MATLIAFIAKYGETILCWVAILFLGWLVYAGAIKPVINPEPTTTQNVQSGGTATTYDYDIKVGFGGCARIPQPEPQSTLATKVTEAVKPIIVKATPVVNAVKTVVKK